MSGIRQSNIFVLKSTLRILTWSIYVLKNSSKWVDAKRVLIDTNIIYHSFLDFYYFLSNITFYTITGDFFSFPCALDLIVFNFNFF